MSQQEDINHNLGHWLLNISSACLLDRCPSPPGYGFKKRDAFAIR
jgi:hypothetical protein